MEMFETIAKRRSVRRFTGEPVPSEDLLRIVDAGRMAATGHNKQPWDFIIVTDEETKEMITARCSQWMSAAGAIIVLVVDPGSRWWMEDGSAAAENILLAATELGYGSCWVEGTMLPHEEYFKEQLGIPLERRILTLIPIGVPEAWPGEKGKRELADVVHWQRWGAKG
jgi:nitroreductase